MRKWIKGVTEMTALAFVAFAVFLSISPARAQDILQEWATIKPPPPPEIKAVTLDPKKTALIVMDFNRKNCVPALRARCAAVLPKVQKLLAAVRAKGMVVVHTYTPNMEQADISQDVTPTAGERVLQVRGDKFQGNDLEKYLKDKGITTILLAGTSGNGAVLFTAIGARSADLRSSSPSTRCPRTPPIRSSSRSGRLPTGRACGRIPPSPSLI